MTTKTNTGLRIDPQWRRRLKLLAATAPQESLAALIAAVETHAAHTCADLVLSLDLLVRWGVADAKYSQALLAWEHTPAADRSAAWLMHSRHPVADVACRATIVAAEHKANAEFAS